MCQFEFSITEAPESEAPAITLSDLARFAPESVDLGMEPNGWAIRRAPMNVFASGAVHERAGELLGLPVSVRFTPVEWTWDYGDGTVRTTSTGGASWAQVGLPELSETATSHEYAERGTYMITVSVAHSVEFRVQDGPWIPVTGTVDVTSVIADIRVMRVRTVLVAENCLQNPYGEGC